MNSRNELAFAAMFRVALSEVRAGAVETAGTVAPDDPLLAAEGVTVLEPLEYSGRFSAAGDGTWYWRVNARTRVREDCRRCLEPVQVPVAMDLSLVFSSGEEVPEGDGVYPVPSRSPMLDLAPAVREEYLLALPQFVECRPDCKGLCPRCGSNLNTGPCGCTPETDSRWDALRAATQPQKD